MTDASLQVDHATLLPMVRRSTGRADLDLGPWSAQPMAGGSGRSTGLWRVVGVASDRGEPVTWSLVVKRLQQEDDVSSPDSWSYWRREADAYASGFLDDLAGPVRAPRCFAVREVRPGTVEVWIDEVSDADEPWSATDLAAVAQDLGELNGHGAQRPLPDHPWLSRTWLRRYVEHNEWSIDLLRRSADDPWVRRMFPPDEVNAALELWNDRERCLAVVAGLPQTVCHLDAFSRNLFRCDDGASERHTVAIDWAFVGTGAVGEELAPLVVASLTIDGVEADAAELERRVINAYVEGLARSGFECDPRRVRLAYALAACLRYGIGPLETLLPVLLDHDRHAWLEQLLGRPLAEICDQFVAFRRTTLWPLLAQARAIERELEELQQHDPHQSG